MVLVATCAACIFFFKETDIFFLTLIIKIVIPLLMILTLGRRRGPSGVVLIALGLTSTLYGWFTRFMDSLVGFQSNPLMRLGLWRYEERWNLLILGAVYTILLLEGSARSRFWNLARRMGLLTIRLGLASVPMLNRITRTPSRRFGRLPLPTDGRAPLMLILLIAWLIGVTVRFSPDGSPPGFPNFYRYPMQRAIR